MGRGGPQMSPPGPESAPFHSNHLRVKSARKMLVIYHFVDEFENRHARASCN